PAGVSSATIALTPIADNDVEGSETVILTLDADASYVLDSIHAATVTIADTPLPVITLTVTEPDAAESGGVSGAQQGLLTLTRTGDARGDRVVSAAGGGPAPAGTDYDPLAGPVTIPAGQSSATVAINPVVDDAEESAKTLTVSLTTAA